MKKEKLVELIEEVISEVLDEKKKRKKRKKKVKVKKDACYHKVKSRYKVWPSAYASGALVKCRKVGAKNWGNSKNEAKEVTPEEESKKKSGVTNTSGLSIAIIQKDSPNEPIVMDEKKKKKKKKKKAGTESSKESNLGDWFKRKGAKGSKGGWVDCNAPDGKGGYKSCGRGEGEKRKRYPACRPTPGACKERGRGKSWGKKGKKK